jgi:hypothetical protein
MKFKNSKQFINALRDFDKTQKSIDNRFLDRPSTESQFYQLGKGIKIPKAYNLWRKVLILSCLLGIELLILWQLYPDGNQVTINFIVCLIYVTFMILLLIGNNPEEEMYIRRKQFARQLLDTLPETYTGYSKQQKQNQERRNNAINCSDPLTYYLKDNEFIEFMQPEQIEQYWKEKRLPRILSEIDKSDNYIELSIARVNEEKIFLQSIVNS